jgi:gliding motility-associated-like protein
MKRHLNHSPLFLYRSGLCLLFLVFGTLKAWAQPCDNPVASVNPCLATPICSGTLINNYCAGTDPVAPVVAPTPFCGAPNNNQFIAFIAGSTTISIQFNVDLASCTGTPDGSGLQAEIYSTTNCATGSAYTSVSNCFSQNAGSGVLLTATGLTIGQTYYLMVDGWSGDICNYTLDLVSGTIGNIPAPPPVPTGPAALCPGVTGTYSITGVPGLNYNWTVSGGGATIVGPANGTSIVVNFPPDTDPYQVNICVSTSNPCGASPATCRTINIVPVVPINPPPFILCSGDAVNYNGTNYTNSAGTGDDGTTTQVVTLDSYLGCDSVVTISITRLPAITATQTLLLCEGETATICGQTYSLGAMQCSSTQVKVCTDASASGCDSTITISMTKVAVAANITPANPTLPCSNPMTTLAGNYTPPAGCFGTITYQWANSAGTILGTGPTLNVTMPGTYFLTVTNTVNIPPPLSISKICTATDMVVVTTSGGTPAAPVVTGNATPCQNGTATYSVVADPTATNYAWTLPAGATITAGVNTNSITVQFGTTSGSVCASITNSCGTSPPGCLAVALGSPPTQPTISGPAVLCTNTGTYTIPAQTGATYSWSVSAGASISSGQGTTSVNVNWGALAAGTVSVTVTNACGNAMNSLPVTIGGAPPAPGAITGNTSICVPSTITYSITAMPGASSYTWTAPANGTITGGQGTTSVTISYPGPATPSGQVCVTATNACGTGPATCVTITSGATPVQPGTITGPTTPCTNATGTTYSITAVPGATTYTWTVPAGASITSGQGTNSVMVNWGSTSGQICVTAGNSCGTSTAQCLNVTLGTAPPQPGTITGPASLCVGAMGTYSIANVAGATTYTWTVPAGVTLGTGQGTNTINVTATNTPGGNITVTAGNTCGNSTASTFSLTVNAVPNSNAGPNISVCGTMATLAAVPSVGTGTWTHTGPGGSLVTYGNANAANSTVTVNMTGTYTFTWTESNNGCTDNDQVTVNFNSTPQAGPATETCNGANNAITVSFNITGGAAPYTVVNCGTGTNAGSVAAGVFTSTSIASPPGMYCFVLNDANSCGPDTISGVKICACITSSANMDPTALSVCEGQQATATVVGTPSLDGNDVVSYALHTNSGTSLGTIIAIAATPVFSFQAPMVYGTTYYISQIVGDNNGSGQVSTNDPCLSVAPGQPVTFYQLPNAQAGADNEICGNTITLDGTPSMGFGQWTQTSGLGTATFDNTSFSDANVSVDQLGVYTFTWTENNNGCTDADQVTISFNASPALNGAVTETCNGAATAYTVSFTITGGEAPYTVLNSATMMPTGTTTGANFVSASIASGGSYSFIIEDNNGCQSVVISGTVTCNCVTNAGTIDLTVQPVCSDASSVAPTLNGDQVPDPDDVGNWILHDNPGTSLGTILGQNQTGVFSYNAGTMTFGTTYYLSYVLGNNAGGNTVDLTDACTDVTQGQPVIFYEEPVANAGTNQSFCGLQTTLAASPGVGNGTWTMASGPGTATFANANDPASDVTVTVNGTYIFTWSLDNNGCTDQDDVQVSFNEDPAITALLELCNATNTAYTVSFTITGGAAPFTVNSNAIAGNTFTSASLASGASYSFTVVDANGCTATISGTNICDCTTQVGAMTDVTTLFEFCTDETACVVYDPAGETLDGDDVMEFVLSTETPFVNIIATSTTPCFDFVAPLQLDVTYYITALVGNNDGTGHVDINDPCLSASQSSSIVYHPTIVASLTSDQTICAGECATLTMSIQGNPPFDVTYTDGTSSMVMNVGNNYTFNVCPPATTTYTITDITNSDGCSLLITDPDATVTVVPASTSTLVAADEVCNTDASGFPTARDFSLYILSGNTSGTWADTDNSGAAGTFPVLDFNGVTPGVYTFTYSLPLNPPCVNQVYTIEITVTDDCQCPDVTTLSPAGGLCNNSDELDLTSLTTASTAAGSWSIIATPPGFNPAYISGNTFVATNGDPGDYLLQYTLLTPPPGTCATFSQQTITVQQSADAGTASPPNEFCQGQSFVVDLSLLLFGADAGGSWTETSTVPSSGGAFDPIAGTFNTASQSAGTYTFSYTVFALAPCTNDFETVTIIINPQPVADAGLDGTLDCTVTALELGPDIVNPSYTYIWTGPIVSQQSNPVVSLPGTYILAVSTAAGCTDVDTVVVNNNISIPTAVISPNFTTLTCTTASSTLDGSTSTPVGGLNYIWTQGLSIVSTDSIFSVQTGGVYVLTVVNPLNTCADTAMVTVPVDQVTPFVAIAAPDQITCTNTLIQLDATASVTGPEYTYQWTATNGGNIVSGDITTEPLCDATGTYTLVITDTSNGCIDSAEVQITDNITPPLAVATATGELDCVTDIVTLSGVGSSLGIGITYAWSTADGHIASAPDGLNIQADEPGTYDLTVFNSNNGCSSTTSVFLDENIDAPNAVSATVIEPNCYGECNAGFFITDVTGGTEPYLYSLDGLFYTTADSFSFLCAGVYNLTVQDIFGCTGQQEIIINQPEQVAIELGRDTIVLLGSDYTLTAIPNIDESEIDSVIWSSYVDTTCLQVDLCLSQTFTPVETGLYSITMTDVNGCTAVDDITIYVEKPQRVFIMNVFSPNGDGINDLFYVQAGPDVKLIKNFRVFDRWGEKLFDRIDILPNDPTNSWDGRLRGVDMNPQVLVYWVEVEFIDGSIEFFKGDLTLLR